MRPHLPLERLSADNKRVRVPVCMFVRVCVASFADATTATGGERIAAFGGIDSRVLGFGYIAKPPV